MERWGKLHASQGAAGADLILLNPLDREGEQMEWLADAVLPRVSGGR